jgi:TolB-like protein/Tfp pilus assembly protein PilF
MTDRPPAAVFLSYASQDGEAVRGIAEALQGAGVEVWFDLDELRGGDEWDRKIKNQIKTCALFVPVISGNTQSRPEGYFRLEWHLAEQRSLLIAKGRAFIVPVCIDETKEGEALVPDAFVAVQWSRPSSDAKLSQFVAQVQRLLVQPPSGSRRTGSASVPDSTTAPKPDQPAIPDYELVRQIGRGSYGDVWLARGATGLWRAIKIVWRERFADADPYEREWRGLKEFAAISLGEASHMALLHIGRNDDAGLFFYVMELADDAERGRAIDPAKYVPLTLREMRKRRPRLPAAEVVRLSTEITRTLAKLHGRGLVHRDIKPSNIILVDGVPKLADIGLVAPASSAQTFVGTEGFVPPEGPGSPSADVYAAGKVIYELATGLDRQDYPRLPSDLSRLPDQRALLALNQVILRACEANAAERYRDATALLADLEMLQAGQPVRRASRRPLVAAAAAASAMLAVGAWFLTRKAPAPVIATTGAPEKVADTALPATAVTGKSLIVLPLENLSPDPADAVFTNGMHEEIVQTLSRIGGLVVKSRATALTLKDTKEPLAVIGQRLGVTYALSGSLRRSGRDVRVSLQLRKMADESLVWQKRFEREFVNGFALQDEIAEEVAKALNVHVGPGWYAGAKFMTKNAEAYELFLKARDLHATKGPLRATFLEQVALGERAMALDPDFMSGAAILSGAYSYLHVTSVGVVAAAELKEIATKAKRWAERAAEIAPGGAGDLALGAYYSMVERDFDRSFTYAQSAVRAMPNDSSAHNSVGVGLQQRGRYREALAAYNRAVELDPMHRRALYNRVEVTARLRDLPAFEEAAAKSLEFGGMNVNRSEVFEYRFNLTGSLPDRLFRYPENPAGDAMLLWLGRKFDDVLAEVDRMLTTTGEMRPATRFAALKLRARAAQRLDRQAVISEVASDMLAIAENDASKAALPEALQHRIKFWALAFGGRKAEALALCRRQIAGLAAAAQTLDRWANEVELALLHAWFGDKKECVEVLGRLLQVPSGVTVVNLRLAPYWDSVRDDPGFQALLADPKNAWPLGIDGPIAPAAVPGANAASSQKSAVSDKSIAVLPFENLSEDKASAFFAAGLHGEILASLTRISQLRVTSRTSVETYRQNQKPLGQIARELGVAYVLEGSVQRDGDRLRLAGRLVRASGDELVWADTFLRPLSDTFALQAELAQLVAAKLQAFIAPKELAAITQSPTKSTDAYQLFLRSYEIFDQEFIHGTGREVQDLLERAVTLDPDFTRAWQDLAEHAMGRYFMGKERSAVQLEKVRAAIDQCMRLAPDVARTLAVVGIYYYQARNEHGKALEYIERAVKQEPNVASHHANLAMVLRRQGKWIESTAELRRAVQLDPQDVNWLRYLAQNMNYTRRFNELADLMRRSEELRPDLPKDTWAAAQRAFLSTGSTVEMDARLAEMTSEQRESVAGRTRRLNWALIKGDFREAVRLDAQLTSDKVGDNEGTQRLVPIALALAASGELAAARARLGDMPEQLRQILEKGAEGLRGSTNWAALAQMEALLGNRESVLQCAARAAELYPEAGDGLWGPPLSLRIASARAWLGSKEDKEFALAEIRRLLRVVADPQINVFAIRHSAAFFPLRGDPRFEAILNDPRNRAPLY